MGHKLWIQALFSFLVWGDALGLIDFNWKIIIIKLKLFKLAKTNYEPYKTFEYA